MERYWLFVRRKDWRLLKQTPECGKIFLCSEDETGDFNLCSCTTVDVHILYHDSTFLLLSAELYWLKLTFNRFVQYWWLKQNSDPDLFDHLSSFSVDTKVSVIDGSSPFASAYDLESIIGGYRDRNRKLTVACTFFGVSTDSSQGLNSHFTLNIRNVYI